MLSSSLVPQRFLTYKKARKSKRAKKEIDKKNKNKETNHESRNQFISINPYVNCEGSKVGGALWKNSILLMASIR